MNEKHNTITQHLAQFASIAGLLVFSGLAFGQNCDVLDTGEPRPADFPSLSVVCGGPGLTVPAGGSPGELTTLFGADNSFAGNTFDLENITGEPITIESFAINLQDVDANATVHTVDIYFKAGTSVGFEADAAAWTLMGSDTNVVGQNAVDLPTPVDVGGLVIEPGEVYGIYVDLATFDGTDLILYTNGGPQVFDNGELQLTSNTGQGNPAFTGVFFPRIWNGTVFYSIGGGAVLPPPPAVPTLSVAGLAALLMMLALTGLVLLRRRS